ncbi:MAG: winged helix-turn-helix transcriptional regulator [Erysipelotrichaceae bacterium]|nr:winged helix-turn-helix transcriptional regulator [Erysipelotrichaceae bacterium]
MKTEVIAFLNSYLGGKIYVGVDNFGNILKISQEEKDLNESKIINWIRDESIYPNCSEFVSIKYNEDDVLEISITPGNNKPYFLKEKGPKSSGVYIRYGRNKSQASQEEITRMIMESNNIFYEEMISSIQDLTFNYLKLKFEEKNLEFKEFKMVTSGFIRDNKYTNLAFIFSDQYDVETKIGVYHGLDRAVFKSKKEFGGSIIKQIDKTLEYYDLCNETRIVIDGSPMRKEFVSYHNKAVREAILNCYCHRDYNRRSNIKIEFFDDRCEIISPGGFYGGLTLEEALNGVQSFRNKYLVQLLHKLGYIENYSSGLDRIFKEYKNDKVKPAIETTLNMFKVTFPNMNYKFDDQEIDQETDQEIDQESIQRMILEVIKNEPTITRNGMAKKLNISSTKIKHYLDKMRNSGLIVHKGSTKSGHWEIVD